MIVKNSRSPFWELAAGAKPSLMDETLDAESQICPPALPCGR